MNENTSNQDGANNSPQQPIQNSNPNPAPNPVPTQNQIPNQPVNQNAIVKKNPWLWIIGGCLIIAILIVASIIFVGWRGAKKVGNEIKKYEPTAENLKNNIDKLSKEAEEWDKKSQELQENLPDPEDFSEELNQME